MRQLLVGICLVLLPAASAQADTHAYVAIIIDDMGYHYRRGMRAIQLPLPVTISVIPHTRHSRKLAVSANRQGKEVMVHLPMANMANLPTGPGGLDASLSRQAFRKRLADAVADVPHARGINNHMGSYLTQQRREMSWLMKDLFEQQLFFVDSRTTPNTIASAIADQNRLLSSSRDVFLDNTKSWYEIDRAFRKLIATAKTRGTAIAIAHPHDITLHYLELALPMLAEEGITVLPASTLITLQQMQRLAENEIRNSERTASD